MFKINVSEVDRLTQAMKDYPSDAEKAINDVLHSQEVGDLVEKSIKKYMPISEPSRRGKKKAAKNSKSLRHINGNLSLTTTTSKKHHYLYFPDDGSNTRRHAGNQQFFRRGGEAVEGEIIDRCVSKLTEEIL